MNELVFRIIAATPWLLVLCVFDIKERRLPNAWTLGGSAAALVYCLGYGGASLFLRGLSAGILCALFLIIPFFLHAAGGGDVKMLFACGILVGLGNVANFLFFVSIAGFLVAVVMWCAGKVDIGRIRHYLRCVFDWRYDRKRGRESLPPASSEKCRVPFGVAIAIGTWMSFAWQFLEGDLA